MDTSHHVVGKTIASIELDSRPRFGFDPTCDSAIKSLVFTDGSRLNIDAVMAGENDSEPFAKMEVNASVAKALENPQEVRK
jgi:hypothetical protein